MILVGARRSIRGRVDFALQCCRWFVNDPERGMDNRCDRQFPVLHGLSSRRAIQLTLVCSLLGGPFLSPFSAAGASSAPSLTAAMTDAGLGRLEAQAQPEPILWIRLSG